MNNLLQALKRERKVRAAFASNHSVDFVDDDAADGAQRFTHRAGEHEIERFGSRDEDICGMALECGALFAGRIARSDGYFRAMNEMTEDLGLPQHALYWCLEVLLDIYRKRLKRRDVEYPAPLLLRRNRIEQNPIDGHKERGQRFSRSGWSEYERGFTTLD